MFQGSSTCRFFIPLYGLISHDVDRLHPVYLFICRWILVLFPFSVIMDNAATTSTFWVQAVILQDVPPFGLSDCFPSDKFQVLCINFHSLTKGFHLRLSPATSQHLCPALLLAGGTARWRQSSLRPQQSDAVLLPTARSPCHCPPCPVDTEPQSYFRPFVVDQAWENLRSWLLDTTAFLRGLKVIPGLGSFGLVAQPLASGSHRPPAGPPATGNQSEGAEDASQGWASC